MTNPREFVRNAKRDQKTEIDRRYPIMAKAVLEILDEMARTTNGVVTQRQIYQYLQKPEDDGGLGLVPGKTMVENYQALRNWVTRRHEDLWRARGGKWVEDSDG